MSLRDIQCTCPDCGAEFSLERAIGEQALAGVLDEINASSDEKIREKVKTATRAAIEEGKEQARAQMKREAEKREEELGSVRSQLTELELEKVRLKAEADTLKKNKETAIELALLKQKTERDQQENDEISRLKLDISRLKGDLENASKRAQQGSMQAQGEASELLVEETLKSLFPIDEVSEVKKGARGADCILNVKSVTGRPVGKINIEVKQTKSFNNDWVEKLKQDSLSIGANFSIIITNAFPADNNSAHMRNGVWVCGFSEYQILITALRDTLIQISKVVSSEEVREEKAQVMFDFLMSPEFAGTMENMIRPILRMQDQLVKEKRVYNGVWEEREKLIQDSISGAESLCFKIQGIAQVNLPQIDGIETFDTLSIEHYTQEG